jgi:hypothetical protein
MRKGHGVTGDDHSVLSVDYGVISDGCCVISDIDEHGVKVMNFV